MNKDFCDGDCVNCEHDDEYCQNEYEKYKEEMIDGAYTMRILESAKQQAKEEGRELSWEEEMNIIHDI